jgi:hypothetical protein
MTISWFLTSYVETKITDLVEIVRSVPGVERALLFTPEKADDPYLEKEATPRLAAELYFGDIAALERAAARDGALQALAGVLPADSATTQQAMLVRRFPVPDARFREAVPCTYLVGYDGPAEDLNAWLAHYIDKHPPIMARFPAIREIEVCTRIDWYGFLPWPREHCMLRNKVVFDSAAALREALKSPVRHEMRADYAAFPPFSGRVFHYPMATREVLAAKGRAGAPPAGA